MPVTVGIICEYNPFHKGHKYQIDQIKKELPDATIVAIMSGNIVQRGEFAILNKYKRAKIALECGVNAVFELPYPYSGSTAEIFACAGVEIASKLKCDYLYFGVEAFEIDKLEKIAKAIDSEAFEREIKALLADRSTSFIVAKKQALERLGLDLPQSSNDMLAVEYIRAIKSKGLDLKYRGLKRTGARYNDTGVCEIMSASAIRKYYYENDRFISVPDEALEIYGDFAKDGSCIDRDFAQKLIHCQILLNQGNISGCFDSNKEIASLILKASKDSGSSHEFFDSLSSKAYTSSRIKRVLMYSMFNVKKVDFSPKFTILLGMDKKGQELLKSIKKQSKFCVITKHSDSKKLSKKSRDMLEKLYFVDKLYNTLGKRQGAPSDAYKNKPVIKK